LLSLEELRTLPGYPSSKRFKQGPVAVIECAQEIPCNPCERACRFNAIRIGKPITNLPVLVEERCKGCGECVPLCPGLAIFIVNKAYSSDEATISIPYEYLPIPELDSSIDALDRRGVEVCNGRVIKVYKHEKNNNTIVVTIAVSKEFADEVRNFR